MYFSKFYIIALLLINFISLELCSTDGRDRLTSEECKKRISQRNDLPCDFLPRDLERVKKADEFVINYFESLSERHKSHIMQSEVLLESALCRYNETACLKRMLKYSCFHIWGLINYFENANIVGTFPSLKENLENLESDIAAYAENETFSKVKQRCYAAMGRGYVILSTLPTDSLQQTNEYRRKAWKNFSNIKKITSKTIYLWKAQLLQNGLILRNDDIVGEEWDNQKNNQENTKIIYDNLLNLLNFKKYKKESKNKYEYTSLQGKKGTTPLVPYSDQLTQKKMKEELYQLTLNSFVPREDNMNPQEDDESLNRESLSSGELENIIQIEENNPNLRNKDNNQIFFYYNSEDDEPFVQRLSHPINQENVDEENIDGESLNSEELEYILDQEINKQNIRNDNNAINNNNINQNFFWHNPEDDQPFVQQTIPSSPHLKNREKRKKNLNNNTKHKKTKHNPKVNFEEKIHYIQEQAQKGMTVDLIANNLGCNLTRLRKFMEEKNIQIVKQKESINALWTVKTLQEAYNLYKNEEKPQRELAKIYNIASAKICKNFKELDRIDKNDTQTLKEKIEEIVKNQRKK